jgi:dipeptidyl aminopeptidase/acylaminoacyl peptidase
MVRARVCAAIALLGCAHGALGPVPVAAAAEAAKATSVRELVEVADIEALALSPDGRKVAFRVQRASVQANTYRLSWHVADLETGRTLLVGDGGQPIYNDGAIDTEPPIWSPDGRYLFHRALVDGAIGLWRTATDGSGGRLVIGGDADVEALTGEDGRSLVYVTGPTREEIARAERREYDEGILVDESVDLSQNLFQGGHVHGRLASQRLVGRWYQRDGLLWRAPRTRHRLDFQSLTATPLGLAPPASVAPLRQGAGTSEITASSASGDVVVAQGDDEPARLEVRRAGGAVVRCGVSACRSERIVALAWRPGRDEVLFTSQDGHFRQTLRVWDIRTGRVRRVAGGEGLLNGGRRPSLPCVVAERAAACIAAGPVSPPRLERISLDDGARTILFDPNAALRDREGPVVEHLTWRLAGGQVATGTILLPTGGRPRGAPLFLNHYFCPGYLRGGIGDEFPFIPLVDAGFVVACLNIVEADTRSDGADRYRLALASVEGVVELLARRGAIDPRRIGMGGFSAGGEATMWVAMHSKLLAAAALASPQYEPVQYWLGSVRGRDHAEVMRSFLQIGTPDEDPARWRLISPALNTGRITVPLLMQLPEQEARNAIELFSKLSNSATPVELYAFPDEGHVKIHPRHRDAVYRRNLDWFRYWLQDEVDPDAARAEQYRRWEALRARSQALSVE